MSFDFFEDGFEEMITEQKKDSSEGKKYIPVTQTWNDGDYIFRIYPENYNGKPRMRRVMWTNQLHNYQRVLSKKDDTRMADLIKEANDRGFTNFATGFWKHRNSKECVMMVELYSAPENKYIHKGTTALVLDGWKLDALDNFLDSIEREGNSLRSFLNPNKPNHAIKMNVSTVQNGRKKETKINFSNTMKSDYELNSSINIGLPDGVEFEGLDQVYIPEGRFMTDEEFESFKEYYDNKLKEVEEKKDYSNDDPDKSTSDSAYEVTFDDDEEDEKK